MLYSNDSGRTMLETLTVLVLIALLTILGLKGFQTAQSKHKVNSVFQDASALATRLLLAKDQSKVQYGHNGDSENNNNAHKSFKTSNISLIDYSTYKNVAIKTDFQTDIDACKHFEVIVKDRTDFAVSEKCDNENAAVVCLVPQSTGGELKYNGKIITDLSASTLANSLCE